MTMYFLAIVTTTTLFYMGLYLQTLVMRFSELTDHAVGDMRAVWATLITHAIFTLLQLWVVVVLWLLVRHEL